MSSQPTKDELENGLAALDSSPSDMGRLEMIVRRPADDERLELESAELNPVEGLAGDIWRERGSRRTEDGSAHPDMQIAIMNSRIIQLVAQDRSRWSLAGDQLYLDLDLSPDNLPVGQHLSIGAAIIEVTSMPHHGCGKFSVRFGSEATKFVNSEKGRELRRRGLFARVVKGGTIRTNDVVAKIPS
jgi:hypothetical protein